MRAKKVAFELEELPGLLDLADSLCRQAELPESLAFKAQVVLEEILVNVFKHAYQDKGGPTEITLEVEDNGFFLRVADQGPAFNPLTQAEPDLQERFDKGIPGGAGLLLIRSMTEDLRYTRYDGRNILEMRIKNDEAPV